jgi:hypothetical protein
MDAGGAVRASLTGLPPREQSSLLKVTKSCWVTSGFAEMIALDHAENNASLIGRNGSVPIRGR